MLPVVFNLCLAPKQAKAPTAHQHQSLNGAHTVFAVTSGLALLEKETPQTFSEAMASEKSGEWMKAMKAEYDGCEAAKTWDIIPRAELPKGANVIPVKWVFKIKTDENGVVTKYKARITPKGFKQKYGQDYFEVFANTGKYKTLRIALSIAASRDLELRQLDVPQAFTQAELEEDVYMEMPEGFSSARHGVSSKDVIIWSQAVTEKLVLACVGFHSEGTRIPCDCE